MSLPQVSDDQLIAGLRAKDEAAVDALMASYGPRIFGLALRLTGNRQDAEEVLQDVLLAVVQKIDTFRGEAKLSSWIYRIAANAALMRLRRQGPGSVLPFDENLEPELTPEGWAAAPVSDWSRPADEAMRRELGQRIAEAISRLPGDYRGALVLRDVEGLSADQAAEALGISVAALKSRLHRARLALRRELAAYVEGSTASMAAGQGGPA